MRKYITAPDQVKKELEKRYGVTRRSVDRALNFTLNSNKCDAIRRSAIELGGEFCEEDFVPNCRTSYVNGSLVQAFPGNVVLTIRRKDSFAILSVDGKTKYTYESVTVDGWGNILAEAQKLSEERFFEKPSKRETLKA